MFVVRRITPTGGSSQYLVETSVRGNYSWRKIPKNEARLFSRKCSATRVAKQYQGVVSEL